MDALDKLYKAAPLYKELFLEQLEFLLLPSRFIAALCSRRAGKTTVVAVKAIQDLINNPMSIGMYLALTDDSVKDIFLPVAKPLLEKYKIRYEIKADQISFSNGSKLLILGANHINKIESFRGVKLLFCIVDEAASFREKILHYLVDEIIGPALLDLQGQLIMVGTPANHCHGLFYKVTEGLESVWEYRKWSGYQNPFVKENFAKDAELFLRRKQCDTDNPKFRREYLGQWCTDADSLMIAALKVEVVPEYNRDTFRSVIGVDFGYNDETVFSVLGWRNNNKKTYVYESFGASGLNVTRIAEILKRLQVIYRPILIVADPAGSGKILMDEFVTKHNIYIQPSKKHNKADYIEILNDAIITGNLVVSHLKTEKLREQAGKVNWNEERTREHEGQPCDHIDALLYAFRESLAYTEPLLDTQMKTSQQLEEEYIQRQIEKMESSYRPDDFMSDVQHIVRDSDFVISEEAIKNYWR